MMRKNSLSGSAPKKTFDLRFQYIINRLEESMELTSNAPVEQFLQPDNTYDAVSNFLKADGPPKIMFYYQPKTKEGENGELIVVGEGNSLFMTNGEQEKLIGKCIYFVRLNQGKAVDTKAPENDIYHGEINGSPLETFQTLLHELFTPMLKNQANWGQFPKENTVEFVQMIQKFNDTLIEAVSSLEGEIELRKPSSSYFVENKQAAMTAAAQTRPEVVEHYSSVMENWCTLAEKLLAEGDGNRREPDEAGPDTELEFWRTRMAKFNNVVEQLKQTECKTVVGVLSAAKAAIYYKWKQIDNQITDSLNEAKDNVKYLSTLQKYTLPLYEGTPMAIIDSLPGLMNNVKMMLTIARYYSTQDRMTRLFVKITNQMINNCKKFIVAPNRLWDQDPKELTANLQACMKLNEAYQEQYRQTKEKLMTQPKVKQFDFNESVIFGKMDLFCKRVQKLMDLFTTIEQFSSLANHNIEGMDTLIQNFFLIVDEFKRKPYELLDYTKNTFDRDFLEYNVNIAELEIALQGFINASFENITSTEHALKLLKQFESILQRETLKADLDSKYTVIFHNYGLDLELVQKLYDKQKHSPPMIRNAPPVSGNIMWSRQLMRRIEEPMRKFKANKSIMSTKESKKIIRTYNRVARALIEFETLWHHAWVKSIEAAKSGLQATLIIRHPKRGKLFVNFDFEILQLIRETKCLQRMGIEVPESAKMVLLQEDKFKMYNQQLNFVLREYDRVISRVIPVVKALLRPHLEDLDRKIQPGMLILTWQSMNIDGYLHRIHSGLVKFEELVNKMNDIIENRIESTLKYIGKTLLVDMPNDQSFTLEQFVALQEKMIKRKAEILDQKNLEVERAVEDLIQLVIQFQLEMSSSAIDDEEIRLLRKHYERHMYLAILSATKNSFMKLKNRLGSKKSSGFLYVERPFFDVDVELAIPNVNMNPSLEEIQQAINRCALQILRCSKKLFMWGARPEEPVAVPPPPPPGVEEDPAAVAAAAAAVAPVQPVPNNRNTFHSLISKDKEIVKSVLLLTGSIEGTKSQVMDYLDTFSKYTYLWKDDKNAAYQTFMRTNPDLDAFEQELNKYMSVEQEIHAISPVHNIGCMSLETGPLKTALTQEAAGWKARYATNLHIQAKEELDAIGEYIKDTNKKLDRTVKDLEDVRDIMTVLKEVRDREADIDMQITPIEEKYQLLVKYELRVPKEEIDTMGDLRLAWKKLRKISGDVSDKLSGLQSGFKRDLVKSVKHFVTDVVQFRNDFDMHGPMVSGLEPMEACERLKKYRRLYEERERKYKTYSDGEALFGLTVTEYPELDKTRKELELLDKLYSLYVNVITTVNGYADILWVDVVSNINNMSEQVNQYQSLCKKLPKQLRDWEAFTELKKTIDDFLEVLPYLQSLSSKSMRPRHWQQVQEVCGKTLRMETDYLKLQHLLALGVLDHAEEVEEICNASEKELQIESKLKQICEDWLDQVFAFNNFKNRGPVILKGQELGEIVEKLEDSQMALGSMSTNRYSAPFREEVTSWIAKLSCVSEIIEQWTVVQSMWVNMEAVFSSGDIAKQLPQEAKRFAGIDKNYMKIMAKAFEVRNVIDCCYGNELMKSLLPHLTEQLELCQKSLTAYLETKRGLFPRFYFVSDPVLLEILSQGSDPQAIQPHLQSVFDSLAQVTFDRNDRTKIMSMHSAETETVKLSNPLMAVGNIEDWLIKLVEEMQRTMKDVVRMAASECDVLALNDFVPKYPAQVGLLGIQFSWTRDCQEALNRARADKGAMNACNKKTAGVLSELVIMTTRDLSPLDRTNVETLITIQVHQRDLFDELVKKKIKDPSDFEWLKQARFYWQWDNDTTIISIADVDFEYCYEYLGCKERLVITPLTDRCYITLSQALGMFLGGAPAGPAGTGKTETVKDLGRTLAKFVVVFNCSDQMDFRAMGKIYKGLAMSGSWGCFDEFNRIDLEVLSVCAQQVQCVLSAARERRPSFVFTDGQVVALDPKCGFFITMNPGYAGRQELPENLKTLFRGCAMMVPDRKIIMKVKLAACGYQENVILSQKFNTLYYLCEQQLSKQPHYDFGLRNILSVLRTAGATKRVNTDKPEPVLLMRTLRDMNLSKMVAEDVPLFLSLIVDLFPGLSAEKARFLEVEKAIANQIKETNLIANETWVGKVVQLYETYLVRHGIMLTGPASAGKSSIIDVLCKALTECGTKHTTMRMNPKAITAPQMFGRLDPVSNDWTDGIFAVMWRKSNKNKNNNTWIILDGPVDAIWIENLNTVLDDNKLLTLANGDRIPMIPNVKLLFENENLNNASPATVSRAGIIFVSDVDLGWYPPVQAWVLTRKANEQQTLLDLFDKYVDSVLNFVRKECRPVINVVDVNLVRTAFRLLGTIMDTTDNKEFQEAHVEMLLIFSLVWAVGGLIEAGERIKVDTHLRSLTDCLPEVQSTESVFEYFVDSQKQWKHWSTAVPDWKYPTDKEPKFAQLVIPTLDSVRYEYLLDLNQKAWYPVLFVGGSGTTKTTSIKQYLSKQNNDELQVKNVTFSSATTPSIFQRTVESFVEKRQGRTFGPAGGKKAAVFIDDINMPEINAWGDQITNEIVRQELEMIGFYNLEKPGEWKNIVDLWFVAAMNQPGGGKNDIPNRLKVQFSVFNVTMPSLVAIDNIYGAMVRGRFVASGAFSDSVIKVATKLTELSISLWQKVQVKMLPTPAKFHYVFNMRDLSRVFQGILQAPKETITDEGYLLSLWRHECERVFCDKLTTKEDKQWVEQTIVACAAEVFPKSIVNAIVNASNFVDFLQDPICDDDGVVIDEHPKFYERVSSFQDLRLRVEGFLTQYNEESKVRKLDLVLFEDALSHLARISRIIGMDRGSGLLVGVGGSGKQSLTKLAAFIAGQYIFQITITKAYNTTALFEDIKNLCKISGFQGKPVTFLFTDAEVKEEGFLEYLNQLLSTGEVANLFPKDELDIIVNDIRAVAKKENSHFVDTWDNLYAYFLGRVRDNLHVMLCFSPVGDKFSSRARKFPALISCCTCDWLLPWPLEALCGVAEKFITSFPMATSDANKKLLINHMAAVHNQVVASTTEYFDKFRRYVYVTPKSYLSFINSYKTVYEAKHTEIKGLADKINVGLRKLLDAGEAVSKMKVELQQKEVSLLEAQKVSQALLLEITASTAKAEKKKTEVMAVKNTLSIQAEAVGKDKAEAEEDLAAAKPALMDAENALKAITVKDLQLLKQLRNPPDIIKRVFDGVILLKQAPLAKIEIVDVKGKLQFKDSYPTALGLMSDMGFLQTLFNFERDNITPETVELCSPYLEQEDFTFEAAKKASGNAAGLCMWVRSMCLYHTIAKVVGPKIDALNAAEAALEIANRKLGLAVDDLNACQAELDAMQEKFDQALSEKAAIQEDAELTKKRMDSANALINGLAGEKARWTSQSQEFADTISKLVGDCALACAFMSYCGPFNKEFRDQLVFKNFMADQEAHNVPMSSDINITKFLVDEAESGEWNLQGLPTDELSTQNGILVTRSSRWPILVDPQGQGRQWIMNREEVNQLRVSTFIDKQFRFNLEECMSFGKPFLIENVEEEIDPILDPVLEKQFVRSGKGFKIALADKEVDYCETFKLFLTTKLRNPHFTPELSARVTVIDFTVTMKGLEDQLLGGVIQREKAELQEQRQKLLEEVNSYTKKIKELEDDLLYRLSSSTGNLLDDTSLIDVLANTKKTSQDVNEKLNNATETEKRITDACEEFRPVATRGSVLYFLVAEMAGVNCMYQTSLAQFLELFDQSITNAEKAHLASKRIANIIDVLTYLVFTYSCRGYFENHKLLFALLLSLKTLMTAGIISHDHFSCLLKGGSALDILNVRKKPKEWIPDASWLHVINLSMVLPIFRDLPDSIFRNEGSWKQWFDQEAPENAKIPEFEERLDKMGRLLLIRAMREDRMLLAASQFIEDTLGEKYIESIPLDLATVHEESHCRGPLVCLLSPGSDPTALIENLAKKKKKEVKSVSMGQGQDVIARRLIQAAVTTGNWVLLQNTHLGLKFLSEVELMMLKMEEIDPEFRVWITSEPHPLFPIGLLQISIKITNEAPVGLKAGLKRSYQWVNQDMLDSVPRNEWRSLLFVQCFIHSIVQERRKFGPIGWSVPYEFNQSDLSASVQFLQNHLIDMEARKAKDVTWTTVRYMVADIQYGGRITDDWDRRLMLTYTDRYFAQTVLDPNYSFSPGYKVPQGLEIAQFRTAIEQLPQNDSPEIFGLHPNADLSYRLQQSEDVLRTIVEMQPKTGGGAGGMTREEQVNKQAEDLLAKMPPNFKMEQVKERLAKMGAAEPMNVFLRQEVDRLQKVISVTRNTLRDLQLAIAGTIALNGALIESLFSLSDARVPAAWAKISWESSNMGLWFTGLVQRFEQMDKWVYNGRPKSFWMTGFFNPQGFLTSMRQEVARKHQGWALDDVILFTETTKHEMEEIKDAPPEGVYVYGLFLDGCAWSKKENKLVDSQPKVLYHPLPVLFITAVLETDSKIPYQTYICPCYRNKKRTGLNFIFPVKLRTEDPAHKWTLRGVSLLCSKD